MSGDPAPKQERAGLVQCSRGLWTRDTGRCRPADSPSWGREEHSLWHIKSNHHNTHAPSLRAPECVKLALTGLKGETEGSDARNRGDFHAPPSIIGWSSMQQVTRETGLNQYSNQMGFIDTCRTSCLMTVGHALLACTGDILQDRSHIRSQNKSINLIRLMSVQVSLTTIMEWNQKSIAAGRFVRMWKLNNLLVQTVGQRINKKGNLKILQDDQNENIPKLLGCCKSNPKKEV